MVPMKSPPGAALLFAGSRFTDHSISLLLAAIRYCRLVEWKTKTLSN